VVFTASLDFLVVYSVLFAVVFPHALYQFIISKTEHTVNAITGNLQAGIDREAGSHYRDVKPMRVGING
jgi:hypothetical protein